MQTTYAAYGNVTYPVLDNLRIDAGLRYTKAKKSTRSSNRTGDTDDSRSNVYTYSASKAWEGTWKDVTYRVYGEYNLTEQAMVLILIFNFAKHSFKFIKWEL